MSNYDEIIVTLLFFRPPRMGVHKWAIQKEPKAIGRLGGRWKTMKQRWYCHLWWAIFKEQSYAAIELEAE